ncbi:hypothetical protein GCM10010260_13100 [Streptomyces filipinensis]|uniref:Uncharacterized protein n=1 Tax=Streptomyces filipinensis TaxID=66887 RepID=A0A918I8M7_9ACTN|nr:hypothetical protein [Streptomyces filipinensis]GGU81918.1 hypothetical protein GCM10010260_13100 [Streptomyces filipinensis]
MYELSRVLLQSVGPKAARYENVLLDFSGVGDPIADRPATLFSVRDEQPVRRPSPATVLFLENGGGKSVLIKLIFSVLLPGRRQVVGTRDPRALSGFVLDNDVAHIALEWTHTRSGRRLVTGKVAEWRHLKATQDPSNLIERWYHFRPTRETTLDTLPVAEDGRYLRLADFIGELDEAQRADPELEFNHFRVQSEWTERLTDLGLDPELFRYQRAMNAGEGEAADVFSFASDAAFVEFLLSAVVPTGPAQDLANLLSSYGDKLGRRGALTLERDFVAGALEFLEPLAGIHITALTAQEEQRAARKTLDAFVRSVKVRAFREVEAAKASEEVAKRLGGDLRRAVLHHEKLAAAARELGRLTALLKLAEAEEEQQKARAAWNRAQETERAWKVVPRLAKSLEATANANRLRELVRRTEEAALPALQARDAALEVLVGALRTMSRRLTEQAETARHQAESERTLSEQAQTEHNAAVGLAAEHRAQAKALDTRIQEVRDALADAVRDGLLSDGVTARDAARQAEEEARKNAEEISRLESAAEDAAGLHDASHRACRAAEQTLAEARHSLDLARRDWTRADERTRALEAEIQPLALLDIERLDLEVDAPRLVGKLAQRRDAADVERTEIRIAMVRDERARLALETNELLPPSPEAAEACETLREAGVDAYTGWDYLAGLPRVEQRRALIERVPHLVTGVLLNDPEQTARATEILVARKLWPSTLVALGTTTDMHEPIASLSGLDFVVPPHPALYDERAAAEERLAFGRRHDEHRARIAEWDARQRMFLSLLNRLEEWRVDFPEGRLAELREIVTVRVQAHDEAQEALTEQTEKREVAAARLKTIREAIPPLRTAQSALETRKSTLSGLASQEERIPNWQTAVDQARTAEVRAREAAQQAETAAESHRAASAEHVRTMDRLTGSAHRMTAELNELPGADAVTENRTEVPAEPLPVLRRAYEAAAIEYERASVGADLLLDMRQAEQREKQAAQELGDDSPETQAAAQALLNGPDGVDGASRAAAQRRAEQAVSDCQTSLSEADASVAEHRAVLKDFPEPLTDVDLAPYGPPLHVLHGMRLIEAAEHDRDEAERIRRELDYHSERAERTAAALRSSAKNFTDLITVLSRSGEPREDDIPYEGGVSAARDRHTVLKTEYDRIGTKVETALAEERTLTDQLVGFAADAQFGGLPSPSRTVIQSCPRAELPARAAEWSDSLRPRLRSLTVDLDSIERHRRQIVLQLCQQVQEALRTLKRAQSLSRLPRGLQEWSEQEFLRIRFTEVSEQALEDRLGTVVDETAEAAIHRKEIKRDGLALLLRGVTEAVAPKGFRVRILKPDAVLRTERVPVSAMKDLFSGGQVLTAAIVLYCTMAALRANEKGRVQHRRNSGVLFLDNPIGRASAGYLLRLQQSVARALGVQLVYTTGLNDLAVLDSFPLVIRLRNDADLRAHRMYLTVVGDRRKHLLEPLEEGENPVITSIRYHARADAEHNHHQDPGEESVDRSESSRA